MHAQTAFVRSLGLAPAAMKEIIEWVGSVADAIIRSAREKDGVRTDKLASGAGTTPYQSETPPSHGA